MNRIKPFIGSKQVLHTIREAEIRRDLAFLTESVKSAFTEDHLLDPINRKKLLLVAAAIERYCLDWGNTESEFIDLGNTVVLAIAHRDSTKWQHVFKLDAYCQAIAVQ